MTPCGEVRPIFEATAKTLEHEETAVISGTHAVLVGDHLHHHGMAPHLGLAFSRAKQTRNRLCAIGVEYVRRAEDDDTHDKQTERQVERSRRAGRGRNRGMKCTVAWAAAVGMLLPVTRAAAVGMLLLIAGCDDKKTNLAPVASSLAPSTPPPPGASVKKFVIDHESKASIEMEAPKEKIKAVTTGGTGTLDIDLTNLTNSRGEVKMDLSTITTSTFTGEKEPDNKAQTMHARTWLEVADGESGKLDERTKEANRYAVYAIRSIETSSYSNVTKVSPTKDGSDDVRTVTMTTKGELLVHGHKVEREAEVEVAFHYDAGAAADKPKAVWIKTKKPLRVVLAEHDVKPRDGFGKIAKGSFHLLGTKVAENADIALDLRAKPQS